jgi:hypothetical protein
MLYPPKLRRSTYFPAMSRLVLYEILCSKWYRDPEVVYRIMSYRRIRCKYAYKRMIILSIVVNVLPILYDEGQQKT